MLIDATEADFEGQVLDGAAWGKESGRSQRHLSEYLHTGLLRCLLACSRQVDAPFLAHVSLCRVPGSGAWLTACPVDDGCEVDAPLFKVTLHRHLRIPIYEQDGFCPCCGMVSDKWADHAEIWPCGGDRTTRHNALRNAFHAEASEAGSRNERENAGVPSGQPPMAVTSAWIAAAEGQQMCGFRAGTAV